MLNDCMDVKMEPLQKFEFRNGSVIFGKKGRFGERIGALYADPLLGIGAIRQIGQQQGGGIRQGEAVNRLFAVPARRFQRLREQKHAADLRAAVDIAEMHVLPRHIDAYARADALLVEHQTVQCLFQKEPSPLTYFDLLITV